MSTPNPSTLGSTRTVTAGDSPVPAPFNHVHAVDPVTPGVIPSARLKVATKPSNADTVTIGGHVFVFLTALTTVDTRTQIKLGADAAACLALLVKAINGTADASIQLASTPFTKALLADAVDATHLRIRQAATQGGAVLAGVSATLAVSETLTDAADVWDRANLTASGQVVAARTAMCPVIIDSTMVAAGAVFVEFPFTPIAFLANVLTTAGVPRQITTDAFTIVGNAVKIALAGGAAPSIQAGDVVTVKASE